MYPSPLIIFSKCNIVKSIVLKNVLSTYSKQIVKPIEYTTRQQKLFNEIDGVDYNFIKNNMFDSMMKHNSFINYNIQNDEKSGIIRFSVMNIIFDKKICIIAIDNFNNLNTDIDKKIKFNIIKLIKNSDNLNNINHTLDGYTIKYNDLNDATIKVKSAINKLYNI